MAVNLSPIGGVAGQFFDNNGNPLVGGKLFTYAAGTTTPQVTFTSASGSTPNSNPIILNGGGRVPAEIWLTDGLAYKFVLYTSTDQLIGAWDNIIGINSNFVNFVTSEEVQTATAGQTVFTLTTMQYQPGLNNLVVYVDGVNQVEGGSYSFVETNSTTVTFTAGLHLGAVVKFVSAETLTTVGSNANVIAYEPAGTGAVTTTVQAKLRETVSVKDFGAVGDGVADDTAAIQAALDSGAGAVYAPIGTYFVSSALDLPNDIAFYGDGVGSTTFTTSVEAGFNMLRVANNNTVHDLTLDGNDTRNNPSLPGAGSGIVLNNSVSSKIYNVHVTRFGLQGIATVNACYNNIIENIEVDICGHRGINIGQGSYNNILKNIISHDNELAGILIGRSFNNLVDGFVCYNINENGFWLSDEANNNVVKNGVIKTPADTTKCGVLFANNSKRNIVSNVIVSGHDVGVRFVANISTPPAADGDTSENILTDCILIGPGSGVANSDGVRFNSATAGAQKNIRNTIENVKIIGFENGFRCVTSAAVDTDSNNIIDCDVSNDVVNGIRFGTPPGAGNNRIRNLIGFTPRGSLALDPNQPAVPATSVAVTNPFPFACFVYVAGLPLGSGVEINGTNINPSPSTTDMNTSFYLDIGQTITLNYSSGTPSWRWWGV